MYGRNTNNIFSKNTSSTGSSNIFTRNTGSNSSYGNNNSAYGNNNSAYGNNNSAYGNNSSNPVGDLGSYRVKDFKASAPPRVLEDINIKWKQSELNPQSISIRPETLHLSVVELRNQDYFLVRQQKMTREIEKAMQDVVKKGCFNADLVNSHIVGSMREPQTFRQGPVSMDLLKAQKTRTLYGSGINSSSPSSNSNSVFGNKNNSSNNIFGGNSSTNNSLSNIFNSSNRNTYGNNNNNTSNNNSNPFNRNNSSSGNNIFSNNNNGSSGNNNGSSGNNMFGGGNGMNNSRNPFSNNNSNMNNSGTNNIFSNNNNNPSSNIFGNNSNSSSGNNIFTNSTNRTNSNIFGNNTNTTNNNTNPFNNNNNNNSNPFNNNNSNSNRNNNIFGGNNIFSNNNNNQNNSRNLFNNNQNNNSQNNNHIFSNQNNQNQNLNQNGSYSFVNQFFLIKLLEDNKKLQKSVIEQNMARKGNHLTSLYFGANDVSLANINSTLFGGNNWDENGNSFYQSQTGGYLNSNPMYNSMGNSRHGTYTSFNNNNYPNHYINTTSYPQSSQLQNYQDISFSPPPPVNSKVKKLLDTSSHPYPLTTSVITIVKESSPKDQDQDDYSMPKNSSLHFDQSSRIFNQHNPRINVESSILAGQERRGNQGNNFFFRTQSSYLGEEMQMRQTPRPQQGVNPFRIVNQPNGSINDDITMERSQRNGNINQSNQSHNLFQNSNQRLNGNPLAQTLSQGESGTLNLPKGYIYKLKRLDDNIVENLQITNEFGTIRWPGKTNISNIDFSKNFSILQNSVNCEIPQLNKECYVTFFNIPSDLAGLEEREAELNLGDYLKDSSNGNIELQMFSLDPPEYRIKIKNFDKERSGFGQDAEVRRNLLRQESENQEP